MLNLRKIQHKFKVTKVDCCFVSSVGPGTRAMALAHLSLGPIAMPPATQAMVIVPHS